MEFTKEYLVKKRTEYLNTAEQCKLDSIANAGAADAIDNLIKEMEQPEATPPAPIERE